MTRGPTLCFRDYFSRRMEGDYLSLEWSLVSLLTQRDAEEKEVEKRERRSGF